MGIPRCQCGVELVKCHMGCGELRCPDDCTNDEIEHERDHREWDRDEMEERIDRIRDEY